MLAWILISTAVTDCFKNNPYLKEKDCDTKKLYVAFLSKELQGSAINDLKISQFKPDEAAIDKNKIFIKYAVGAGKTRLKSIGKNIEKMRLDDKWMEKYFKEVESQVFFPNQDNQFKEQLKDYWVLWLNENKPLIEELASSTQAEKKAKKEMAELTLMIRVNPNFFFKKSG